MRRALVGAWLLVAVSGCQSMRSWQQGCPGIYSGARFYGEQLPELPFDGKVFFSVDLLPTLVVDSLALPVTSFSDPLPPPEGYSLGCRWAAPGSSPRY